MPSTSRGTTISTLSLSAVRELAGWRGRPVVTSIYIDVDGRSFPRRSDVGPEIMHLVRMAKEQAASLGQAAIAAVDADLDHVHRWLADSVDRASLRGIALFSCDGDHRFRAFGLSTPVREQAAVGPTPAVRQLCEALARGARALVVLVDQRNARVLRLEHGQVDEHAGPADEPPRQVDTDVELGSFERFQEEAIRRHLRRSAHAVAHELARWPAEHLVLGGPNESVTALEQILPPTVMALAAGRITLSMRSASDQVARAAWDAVEASDVVRRSALVDDLRQRVERATGGVAGLAATLEALGERRVGTLVLSRGLQAPGGRCPRCARLVAESGATPCPQCETSTDTVADVVEAAVATALGEGAAVEVCDGAGLEALGGIGAIERF